MNLKYLSFSFILLAFLTGCKQESKGDASLKGVENAKTIKESRPHAELEMPNEIDMGFFEGGQMKKTVDVEVKNTGNSDLYITEILPDCDCTELSIRDSIVSPGSATMLHATLDLTGYPSDTIRKTFGIISSSLHDRVRTIALVGIVKE